MRSNKPVREMSRKQPEDSTRPIPILRDQRAVFATGGKSVQAKLGRFHDGFPRLPAWAGKPLRREKQTDDQKDRTLVADGVTTLHVAHTRKQAARRPRTEQDWGKEEIIGKVHTGHAKNRIWGKIKTNAQKTG